MPIEQQRWKQGGTSLAASVLGILNHFDCLDHISRSAHRVFGLHDELAPPTRNEL